MALMVTLPSACGRKDVRVDFYDYPWATESSCCNECQSILLSRLAWMDDDGSELVDDYSYEDYMEEMWGMDGN
jgi:hypothetical protein